jgi:hypothetical protein
MSLLSARKKTRKIIDLLCLDSLKEVSLRKLKPMLS